MGLLALSPGHPLDPEFMHQLDQAPEGEYAAVMGRSSTVSDGGWVMHLPGRSACLIIGLLLAFATGPDAGAEHIVFGGLDASLDTGSLAGTRFPVSFSYDESQVEPVGDSFIGLSSFDFTLGNASFTRNDIFQGGQVIFRNGVLDNVTASFQAHLPPQSPVENITFGFGGPGIIGYIDLNRQFGSGSFRFVTTAAPEPPAFLSLALGWGALVIFVCWDKRVARATGSSGRCGRTT